MLRMIKPIPSLSEIMSRALAAAHPDIYTANPKDLPFPHRTQKASQIARAELMKVLSGTPNQLILTRKEALRAFAKENRLIRGPIGEAWLQMTLDSVLGH